MHGEGGYKRLTVDMTPEEHKWLKAACAQGGVSMRDFVLMAVHRQLEEYEDKIDAKEAAETLARVRRGEEPVISWEEMEKRLGWDAL